MNTVQEILRKNYKDLLNHNIQTGKIDSEVILANILNTTRINLTMHKLTGFLAGDDFSEMSDALQMKHQEELLESVK